MPEFPPGEAYAASHFPEDFLYILGDGGTLSTPPPEGRGNPKHPPGVTSEEGLPTRLQRMRYALRWKRGARHGLAWPGDAAWLSSDLSLIWDGGS